MHYTEEITIKESIADKVKRRNEQAEIMLEIIRLAKKLEYCRSEIAEEVKHPEYTNEKMLEKIRKSMDYNFWKEILNENQVEKFITTEDKEKLRDKLSDDTPIFDFDSAFNMIQNFTTTKKITAIDMIKKVHNTLTDEFFTVGNNHKNDREKRLQKGIKPSFRLSMFYGGKPRYVCLDRSRFSAILDFERAMYLCDSKLQPDAQFNIQSIADKALRENLDEFENEYFKVKVFKNGNIKVDVKRLDVLETFNKWGRNSNTLE